jgi:uncharacterized BrkB/YihY/UPF0761 family membrane protein
MPLIGMQLSSEINWELFDFIVAGIIITVLILVIELIFRKIQSNKKRLWLVLLIGVLFIIIWVELAVGIFGSPFAGT